MDKQKKYLARSFYFLLYQFLRYKYDNIDVVFISHSSKASEVSEEEFFQKATTGGTLMSTALELEKEIIDKRYHPSSWNIYTFYSGDGENWSTDNQKTIDLFGQLKEVNQMMCYAEINPFLNSDYNKLFNFTTPDKEEDSGLWGLLTPLASEKFKKVRITEPSQIWPSFKKLFGGSNQ